MDLNKTLPIKRDTVAVMSTLEAGGSFQVSPFNLAKEIQSQFSFPDRVKIADTTLRDGEQSPGVIFNIQDKLAIAQMLDEAGIDRIEVGNPVISTREKEAVRRVARSKLKAEVYALARAIRADIDLALECGVEGVYVYVPVSDLEIERKFRWSREKAVEVALESLQYAKDQGLRVSFFPFDTTRADLQFIRDFLKLVEKETDVDSIVVVDTVGCITPQGMFYLVSKIREMVNLPLEAHCHNDFGLATANALAAVCAGAEVVHTCVNGLGERAGNSALDEVVLGLSVLYGLQLDIKLERLYELSKEVEKRSGLKVAANKPLVGDRVFTFSSGLVIDGLRRDPFTFLPLDPGLLNREISYLLEKSSGRGSVRMMLDAHDIDASPEQVEEILQEVKEYSEKRKRVVSEGRFKEIAHHVLRKAGSKLEETR